MAKDKAGRKYNRIESYTRVVNGKRRTVGEHVRSNQCKPKRKR